MNLNHPSCTTKTFKLVPDDRQDCVRNLRKINVYATTRVGTRRQYILVLEDRRPAKCLHVRRSQTWNFNSKF